MIGKHVVIDTLDNFKAKLDQIPSSAIVLIKDVGQIYAHGTYFGAQKTYSLLTKTADGLAPKGGTSASSQISDVDTEWVLTVTNGENPTWRKLPANAFSSLQYTLLSATVSNLGGIKVGQVYTATFDDLVGQYYKVNIDKNGLAYVHVPWVNNPYTASGNGITLKDNVFSLSLNSVTKLDSAIGNKIYAVSLDKNGKLCVSVPWTDTNNIFVGATETKNGSSGMVPAPIANQHNYFLRGDGTWVKPNLSDFTDDVVNGKYLPLSGGTLTGNLTLRYANPRIILKDAEGITLGSFGLNNNVLSYYKTADTKWYNIWHEGNQGSGSGLDADLLDGLQGAGYQKRKYYYLGTVDGAADTTLYANTLGYATGLSSFHYFNTMFYHDPSETANRGQIAFGYYSPSIHYRVFQSDSWSDWKTIAFTDSNVASATKLQTPRTIWGQSFDGTGNVSGNLTLGNSESICVTDTNGASVSAFVLSTANNLLIGRETASMGYITYLYGSTIQFRYGTSRTDGMILNGSGNVTIGSSDLASTSYKLYVDGTMSVNGNFYHTGAQIRKYNDDESYRLTIGYYGDEARIYNIKNADTNVYGSLRLGTTNVNCLFLQYPTFAVGIGTTSPSAKLHVAGDILATKGLTANSTSFVNGQFYITSEGSNALIITANAGNPAIMLKSADTTYGRLTIGAKDGPLYRTNAGWTKSYKIWDEGNDGAGSGLDSDLLDGQEGSWYQNNVISFSRYGYTGTNQYDANVGTSGMIYNYGAYEYWKNAPSGMTYGQILTLRSGSSQNLAGQLAWDINHNSTTDTTRSLWWRATDAGDWIEAKWHQIAFIDNIPTVTDYYWANVKIKSSEDNTTVPTFGGMNVNGKTVIISTSTGESSINANCDALVIGSAQPRAGTANYYYPGIALTHMWNYGGATTYNKSPQAWIGTRLYNTEGSERSALVFATKGTSGSTDRPTERMCITYDGKVGIGTITPKAKLSVYIEAGNSNPTVGTLGTSSTFIIGCNAYGTSFWTRGTGYGYIQQGRFDGTNTSYPLILQLLGGNVGIGTESPTQKLDVNGTIKGNQLMSTNIRIECDNNGAYGDCGSEINNFNGNVYLQHKSSNNLFLVTGGGKVGVGKTSPDYKLDVNGTFNSSNYQVGGALELKTDDTACQTTVFGSNHSGYRMRVVRQATSTNLNTQYSPTLVLSSLDTHAYFAWSYGSAKAWIGAGAGNKWNWRSELITSSNIGSQKVDKAIKLYYSVASHISTKADLDGFLEAYTFKARTWNGTNAEDSLSTSYPGTGNGTILSGGYTGTTYGFQLAIDDNPNWFIALRQKGNGTWAAWKRIPMGDGTGASGTWGISITGKAATAGDADTLDSQHGDWYRKNVLGFTYAGTSATNEFDCNTLNSGIIYNYGAYSYWKNGPSGMYYGQVLNLRRGDSTALMGQLAWDINHNSTTDTTRNLWWRASDDGTLTEAKWHQIVFADTKIDNATNADKLARAEYLQSDEAINGFLEANKFKFAQFKTTSQNQLGFASNDGMLLSIPWSSADYGFQLAFDDDKTCIIKARGKSSSWGSWYTLCKSSTITTLTVTSSAGTDSGTIYFVT